MKFLYSLLALWFLISCSNTYSDSKKESDLIEDTVIEKRATAKITQNRSVYDDPYRKLVGMEIGEEKVFHATDTNYHYQLVINKINEDSLKFLLNAVDKNGVIKSVFGKLAKRIYKRSDRIERRFGTSLPTLTYSLSSKETSTELVIDKERAEFIQFDYFINSKESSTWNETDLLKVGVNDLLLQVPNPYEDYKAYFHQMIEKVRESPQTHLATTSKLLDEYYKANTDYVLSKDSSLLHKIDYYKLDSIQKLMEDIGVEFNIRVLPNGIQSIPINFSNNLIVDLLRDRKTGINTRKFYRMSYSDHLRYGDLKFDVGLWKLFADKNDFIQYNDSLYLGTFSGFGFETVNHLLTLWKPKGDSLVLEEILNKVISVGIGQVEVDTLIISPDNNVIIIGKKSGGDEGYVWGGFWIGVRSKPGELNMVLERNYEGMHDRHEMSKYRFLNDSTIELETILSKWENKKMVDSLINVELINVYHLANGALVIPEDLRCSRIVLNETYDALFKLDSTLIDRFLRIISNKCKDDKERNYTINELLMRIFEKYSLIVAKLLSSPENYEFDVILNHIKKPTSDLHVNIESIIDKLENADFKNTNSDKVIEALNHGLEYYKATDSNSNN